MSSQVKADSIDPHVLCLFLASGAVHSGLCAGVSAGKVHEEGVFWTAKGCRNGGTVITRMIHSDILSAFELNA